MPDTSGDRGVAGVELADNRADGRPSPVAGATPQTLVRLRDFVVGYPEAGGRRRTVLRIPALDIERGKVTCIVGRSGCGKSTLLNALANLVTGWSGTMDWCGGPMKPGEIGLLFQEAALFPWMRVLKNVTIGLRNHDGGRAEHEHLARQALETVGLGSCEDQFPHQLSGGMKQRVVLARYLAARSSVLLMDEPFSALDQFTREEMQDQVLDVVLQNQMTCVFVTHSIVEAVYLGSRVIVLGGRPADVVDDVQVTMPYPRTAESRVSAEGADLRERLYRALKER